MINYDEVTLEQVDYIDGDVVCDGDKKQIILEERSE